MAVNANLTDEGREPEWFTAGVRGIGGASLLSDLGHEVPTSLLPSLLTSTLHAPAASLGVIEGIADGLAGIARLGGGALADDPSRRRSVAVGGYTATAVLSGLIGAAGSAWQVGVLRAGAWTSRGLRVPARNVLLADVVPKAAYGRAYGFERAMDNFGAIGGPLLAIALVALVGVRSAILLSIIPGLLATAAIVYAIRHTAAPQRRERRPIKLRVRPLLHGELGRLMVAIGAFEAGNLAATLMILRATELLQPGRTHASAVQLALVAYAAYNAAATLASILAGRAGDRIGTTRVLAIGAALFLLAYVGLAVTGASLAVLGACFVIAGIAIGCAETAQSAAVAHLAPVELRGSAFGLQAGLQSAGNLVASIVAGVLWTLVSPAAAFLYAAAWMGISLIAMLLNRRR
ncbi:MAG: MFS transporter [Actinomycetota bacterium]|nr:MFS transporter [Actinomycetota bacterium]